MRDQQYYGHGKLLLTGEYVVLDGAQALAVPTTVGQQLKVQSKKSYEPYLHWKALDHRGQVWFEATMDLWRFEALQSSDVQVAKDLQHMLKTVRQLNPHFLRENEDVWVETKLEFPREWGLGSSSSLLYNVAQWAYVSPFELNGQCFGGSGYDIACAQSMGPITYRLKDGHPKWQSVSFDPVFKNQLYLIYSGKKQKTTQALKSYQELRHEVTPAQVDEITLLTKEMTTTGELRTFQKLMTEHEHLLSQILKTPALKHQFSDFPGAMKSLGAWGGDFYLVASDSPQSEIREYFEQYGLPTMIAFPEMTMLSGPQLTQS